MKSKYFETENRYERRKIVYTLTYSLVHAHEVMCLIQISLLHHMKMHFVYSVLQIEMQQIIHKLYSKS